MILQYCLSVYSLNFFSQPQFTTFKIRIINQQNGDCSDSRILDSQKLDSNTFPVIIKIKGTERLLIKVKLLSIASKSSETAIGEGVVSFDKNNIDDSLRVPIYDKKRGVEEVAICSLDLFISGHQLDRNTSGAIDKSKSKVEDWRDDSDDAVFSQMSFTVESDKQLDEEQIAGKIKTPKALESNKPKQQRSQDQKESKKGKGHQLQANRLQQPKQINLDLTNSKETVPLKALPHQENRLGILEPQNKLQDQIKKGYPLQNSIYLSEQSRRHFQQSKPPKDNYEQNQHLSPQIKQTHKQPERQEDEGDDESQNSLSPARIRQRIRQNQDLMQRLRRYLDVHKQSEAKKLTSHQPRHKRRKREVKVEDLGTYNTGNSFIKYYKSVKDNSCKLITKFKAICCKSQEVNDNPSLQHQVQINKLLILSPQKEKLAVFDGHSYRSSCLAKDRKEVPFSIKIGEEESIKVIVRLQEIGELEGTLGVQEGQQMSIKLSPCQGNKKIYNSVLSRDEYYLKFSIAKAKQNIKVHMEQTINNLDVSIKQPEQIFKSEDIKSRIRSLSMQPWAYGQSYLQQGLKHQPDLPRINPSKPASPYPNSQLFPPQPKETPKITSHQQQPKEVKDSPSFSIRRGLDQTNSNLLEQSQELSFVSSNKEEKKQSKASKNSQNQIKAINRIRNGNRNNYRFKESRVSHGREKDKKTASIKQMWERLLIKKKVEEDALQREQIQDTTKLPSRVIHQQEKSSSQNQRLGGRQKIRTANLYGHIEGSREVIKIKPGSRQDLGGSQHYPLRSIAVEVNNISITQPQAVVDVDRSKDAGKFVRLSIKDKITYYTQIIFNGQFNSILWKLSGCFFRDLLGSQKLEVQIFKTLGNQIVPLGKAAIRASKLYFLRNNHIYNGKITSPHLPQAEFIIGFQVQEFYPFEVVQEQRVQPQRYLSDKKNYQPFQKSQSKSIRQTKQKLPPMSNSLSYERMKSKSGQDLKDTLRRERRDESIKVKQNYEEDRVRQSQQMEEQDDNEAMPKGIQSFD